MSSAVLLSGSMHCDYIGDPKTGEITVRERAAGKIPEYMQIDGKLIKVTKVTIMNEQKWQAVGRIAEGLVAFKEQVQAHQAKLGSLIVQQHTNEATITRSLANMKVAEVAKRDADNRVAQANLDAKNAAEAKEANALVRKGLEKRREELQTTLSANAVARAQSEARLVQLDARERANNEKLTGLVAKAKENAKAIEENDRARAENQKALDEKKAKIARMKRELEEKKAAKAAALQAKTASPGQSAPTPPPPAKK